MKEGQRPQSITPPEGVKLLYQNPARQAKPIPPHLKQKLMSHPRIPTKEEFALGHKRALQPYTMITSQMQKQLQATQSWREVVELHKKYHPLYDTTLISAFLRYYNQEALRLQQEGRLKQNLKFMTNLD